MKVFTCLSILLFSFFVTTGQTSTTPRESPGEYFNKFQEFLYTNHNSDSALYYIRKLAANERFSSMLSELMHNSFGQSFTEKKDPDSATQKQQLYSRELLSKMVADTTARLVEAAKPIRFWVEAQENKNNNLKLTELTNQFIGGELSIKDLYPNKIARYGLFIHQILSTHTELSGLNNKLFQIIYHHLANNQVTITDSSKRLDFDKRAWSRYLYAYCNYLLSEKTESNEQKQEYMKNAFDYSPDLIDKNNKSGYFYDMVMLWGDEEHESFKTAYLDFLVNSKAEKQKILKTLLDVALTDPGYKYKLREFYTKNNIASKSFKQYWSDAVNSNSKTAPAVLLKKLDDQLFSSKQLTGKWILVDFWGTWCLPCRAEHPDIQKFYDSVIISKKKYQC